MLKKIYLLITSVLITFSLQADSNKDEVDQMLKDKGCLKYYSYAKGKLLSLGKAAMQYSVMGAIF